MTTKELYSSKGASGYEHDLEVIAIDAVATDMASAYYSAVLKNLPNAKHVFDRFHIVKLMNNNLAQLRRELQREAEKMGRKTLKGLRWFDPHCRCPVEVKTCQKMQNRALRSRGEASTFDGLCSTDSVDVGQCSG